MTRLPLTRRQLRQAVNLKAQALVTGPMTANCDVTGRLADEARRAGLPTVHDVLQLAGIGLMVYGPDFEDIFRRAGLHTARIVRLLVDLAISPPKPLRLIRLAEVQAKSGFPMTINLKTVAALGIKIPGELLIRAEATIQ